ncbi:SH3 domain protein [Vibrio cholerae]|nr:SH3 domain protein [Vibrio cholerae]
MEVIVVEEHTSEYPNPIYLKQGDEVQLGEMDDEFPNWIFITTDSGVQGWTPVQYIEPSCENGKTHITNASRGTVNARRFQSH